MVFKLILGLASLALCVSAANFKRVTCPDGKHTATNSAVRPNLFRRSASIHVTCIYSAASSSHFETTFRISYLTTNVEKKVNIRCPHSMKGILNVISAHEVLRLAFHDAIGFSKSGALKLVKRRHHMTAILTIVFRGTGADGSMILFSDIETAFCMHFPPFLISSGG